MDMNQMRAQQQAAQAQHNQQHAAAAAEHEATLQSAAQFGNPRDAAAQSYPSQYAMGAGGPPNDMMGGPSMAAATAQGGAQGQQAASEAD